MTTQNPTEKKPPAYFEMPGKAGLGLFADLAHKWLSKTLEAKKGLEIQFDFEPGKVKLSSGSSGFFLEATIPIQNVDPVESFCLDLGQLSKVAWDQIETIQVGRQIRGTEDRGGKSIHFKLPRLNFKIPVKSGTKVQINQVKQFTPVWGRQIPRTVWQEIKKFLELPNSFGQKENIPQVFWKIQQDIEVYSNDSFGAFYHRFTPTAPIPDLTPSDSTLPGEKTTLHFLEPLSMAGWNSFSLQSDPHYVAGAFQFEPGHSLEAFRWFAPHYQKPLRDVPAMLTREREKATNSVLFEQAALSRQAEEVTMFFDTDSVRSTPVEMAIVQNHYTLSGRLPQSEVAVEGELGEPIPQPIRLRFQGACLKDYLKRFNAGPLRAEIFSSTIVLYQTESLEKDSAISRQELVYWMPIHER